jgi:putative addiction module killer protein
MFRPLGQEDLSFGSTIILVTGFYFQQRGSMLVILLAGGDKSNQSKDIKYAQDLARNFKEDE